MKIMTTLSTVEDQRIEGTFGVLRMTQTLARMLLSRKLLMELAGALYTDHFVMEFTETSMGVFSDLLEPFQESEKWLGSAAEGWVEVCDLPAFPGRIQSKIGCSVIKLTKNGFWWEMNVASEDGDLGAGHWEKVRTAEMQWSLVSRVAGEFDPREAVSTGSFLVHWNGE